MLAGFQEDGGKEERALCVFFGDGFGWFLEIGMRLVGRQEVVVCFLLIYGSKGLTIVIVESYLIAGGLTRAA